LLNKKIISELKLINEVETLLKVPSLQGRDLGLGKKGLIIGSIGIAGSVNLVNGEILKPTYPPAPSLKGGEEKLAV